MRNAVLTYRPNEMRFVQNLRSEYFPYGTNNWLIRALLYRNLELVNFRKIDDRSSGNLSNII